jgi:DNA-directed RNA polymerase specialized sigma24 family protein
MIGLVKAAQTWDPSVSQFSTFASKCIMNEFANEFKRRSKHVGVLSLDYELSPDDGESASFGDHIAGEMGIDYVDLEGYRSILSPRERQMVDLKLKGYNELEIAKETGWSKQYTYATMRSAKRKWERYYGKNSN